jgi:hypothetical protein
MGTEDGAFYGRSTHVLPRRARLSRYSSRRSAPVASIWPSPRSCRSANSRRAGRSPMARGGQQLARCCFEMQAFLPSRATRMHRDHSSSWIRTAASFRPEIIGLSYRPRCRPGRVRLPGRRFHRGSGGLGEDWVRGLGEDWVTNNSSGGLGDEQFLRTALSRRGGGLGDEQFLRTALSRRGPFFPMTPHERQTPPI